MIVVMMTDIGPVNTVLSTEKRKIQENRTNEQKQ